MRKVSAPVLFILGLLAVAAAGGATFGVATLAGVGDDEVVDGDAGGGPAPTTPTTTTGGFGEQLAAGQVEVTGTATVVNVERIRFDPLPMPLSITTPERGLGAGARLEDVLVDGDPALVTWDAGRPFELGAEGGSLVVGLVNLYLGPGTAVVGFPDGGVHGFAPGSYRVATPVAVARGAGLAESRESVEFEATDSSTVSFTGGASAPVEPLERDLVGPGRVVLEGTLTIRHPDGSTTSVGRVELPEGAFQLHVLPLLGGGGWDVRALLQGELATA